MEADIKLKHEPTHLTDYRMVKLTDGTLLVGSVVVDDKFLRIENPLQLQKHAHLCAQTKLEALVGCIFFLWSETFISGSFRGRNTPGALRQDPSN